LHGELAGQYFGGETQSQRIQTVFEAIYDLTKRRETVTVYTRHAVYNNMVIQSVNIPRNASIGEAIEFKMELVNIRLVSTQMVTVPPGISAKPAAKSTAAVAKKTEPQKTTGKTENVDLTKKRDVSASKQLGTGIGDAIKDIKGLYK
jgi:sorbitol-specific phosphotransferase system component IIBC